jgi:hypothetical protein
VYRNPPSFPQHPPAPFAQYPPAAFVQHPPAAFVQHPPAAFVQQPLAPFYPSPVMQPTYGHPSYNFDQQQQCVPSVPPSGMQGFPHPVPAGGDQGVSGGYPAEHRQASTVGTITDEGVSGGLDNRQVSTISTTQWRVLAKIGQKEVSLRVDTGAGLNVISLKHLNAWGFGFRDLRPSETTLHAFDGAIVCPCGVLFVHVDINGRRVPMKFHVVGNCKDALLSFPDTIRVGILIPTSV